MKKILHLLLFCTTVSVYGQTAKEDSTFLRENYVKIERLIPMRDGVKLFTAIYIPKDASQKYPFLLTRTPYSCAPYGEDNYPRRLTSNQALFREKYIFVRQDVRGRYMSEGQFEEVTPHKPKKTKKDTDESSDTFDTIEWLLKNIRNNNGRVGLTGISYPGFYATAALPDAHPALKAVSPQAPVTDEFIGDDAYHNGAFFLLDNASFMNSFDAPRNGPVQQYGRLSNHRFKNAYDFYLDLGPIKNVNELYFKERGKIWNEYLEHNTYDAYWQARNIRQYLKNIKPAVLVVGGWFDAEDLFGALRTYEAIEKQSPANKNHLVMGPWTHGAWAAATWDKYAGYTFGSNTADYFKDIETRFFNYYLKDKGSFNQAEASIFETGSNQWREYESWPPRNVKSEKLYLQAGGKLSFAAPETENTHVEYVSDPARPVPYTANHIAWRDPEYMAADQRFVSTRPDVQVFQSEILTEDITLSGPLVVNFYFSTTGSDADFVVKLIDVLAEQENAPANPRTPSQEGLQQLVRGDVLRGKFRNSFEKPEPFIPGAITPVTFTLNDVAHTFKKGHRIMIQVQHSWFPLVDRNPQKFMDISKAEASDFQKATHQLYFSKQYPSHVEVLISR
ncbi:MAG: CocE/NonD family hydrolase [Bacteroidetes bacterium CHB5]|nr:CocE/NonD family hydrolase [Bacteroidetes bacterium CHB5]